ncbi:MAG: hypothetical protein ACE5QW_07185 [Thermoplasmata archaeon]
MIEEIIVAVAIGGSLGNSWICALLSLGCTIEGKKSGVSFVAGRYLGLVLLGSAIIGLGLMSGLKPTYFLVIFGVLSVAMGVFVLQKTLRSSSKDEVHSNFPFLRRPRHRMRHERKVMGNGGSPCKEFESRPKLGYVFLLGVSRGATPCLKVMVLVPLLISVDFGLAILMILAYATASTIYPIIGFLSGNLLRQWRKYAFHIRVGAALLIMILGMYFIVNALGGSGH